MDDKNIIQIINLKKSFKRIDVLQGINLCVRKGAIFALLTPNGAGKTTIIKILSTFIKPDSDTALLAGCDVVKNPKGARKNISLTGQYSAIGFLVFSGKVSKMFIGV